MRSWSFPMKLAKLTGTGVRTPTSFHVHNGSALAGNRVRAHANEDSIWTSWGKISPSTSFIRYDDNKTDNKTEDSRQRSWKFYFRYLQYRRTHENALRATSRVSIIAHEHHRLSLHNIWEKKLQSHPSDITHGIQLPFFQWKHRDMQDNIDANVSCRRNHGTPWNKNS